MKQEKGVFGDVQVQLHGLVELQVMGLLVVHKVQLDVTAVYGSVWRGRQLVL